MATEAADIPEEQLNAQTQGVEDEVRRTISEPKCACLLATSPDYFPPYPFLQTLLEFSLIPLV
jgi:hypothetical protein